MDRWMDGSRGNRFFLIDFPAIFASSNRETEIQLNFEYEFVDGKRDDEIEGGGGWMGM